MDQNQIEQNFLDNCVNEFGFWPKGLMDADPVVPVQERYPLEVLTAEAYKAMVAELRAEVGNVLADQFIAATQSAFGGVNEVVKFYGKGLVKFVNGDRWIYNWNRRNGRFYMGAAYKVVGRL